ncbi:MAG: NTP transferase domain-containing protein, partial [Solirubrobacteraceae bacterium]
MPSFDAIVLAGGRGRRLGGVDKAALRVGDKTLLTRALDAVAGASRQIVVGPPRSLPDGVVGVSEEPLGGGPVAGLAAGLVEI